MEESKVVEIKKVVAALDLSRYSELTFGHAYAIARPVGPS